MINERVKQLRQTLNLSGEKFGERLGVKRAAISKMETATVGVTEQTIKSICREFNVNEEWLRTGNGEMFAETVDEYINKFNLDELERKIVTTYLSLNDEQRATIKEYIKKLTS